MLTVCKNCSDLGEPVREARERRSFIERGSGKSPPFPRLEKGVDGASSRKPTGGRQKKPSESIIIEIVDHYPRIVKEARGKLTLEEFSTMLKEKASIIQKIENGKMKPTIQLAKKIERMFHVKLVEKREEAEDLDDTVWRQDKKTRFVPSLGDFMKQDGEE